MGDHELLREYIRSQSQEAFRQLVDRHLAMVLSAARRMVGDVDLAQEVAQDVFTALAQKAGALGASPIVGGWLYNTTRHKAMHMVRTEHRRREREGAAAAIQALETNENMEPILDRLEPAMAELEEGDRDALVLRYLEDRSLREVGQELGIGEDAARMRVNRALERLRTIFAGQGVAITSIFLGTALAASTTAAVPAGLAAAITATALAGTAAAATTAARAVLMTMFNAKAVAALIGAAIITGAVTYLVQQRQVQRLQADNQSLLAQQAQASAEQEAAAKEQLDRLRKDSSELMRLRNEVGQLRRERDALMQRAGQAAAGAGQSAGNPGRYISKEQLAFAGYSTPEAALESTMWAMMKGTWAQVIAGFNPEMAEEVSQDPGSREQFEKQKDAMVAGFRGMQILARKTLDGDRVELKVKMDADFLPNSQTDAPPVMIQPMAEVGGEWKASGSSQDWQPSWDNDGQIQSFAQ
jgi:RNA polymerase sigma factor (sigma-70 family)